MRTLGEGLMYSERGPGDPKDYEFFSLFHDAEINSTRLYMLLLYAVIRSNGLRNLVEIGVMHGVTTSVLARAAEQNGGRLLAVDINADHIKLARDRVQKNGLDSLVHFWLTDSKDCGPLSPVDFLFIDGDHSYEGVKGDWNAWHRKIEPGGIVAFHDTADERIAKFLKETFPMPGWEFINFPGDCGLALARRSA